MVVEAAERGKTAARSIDVYLKGAPPEEMNSLPGLYPELKIGITTAFPQQQTAK